MDIKEFTNRFADATKHLSSEETAAIMKLFQGISKELSANRPITNNIETKSPEGEITGLTPRLERLRAAYLKVKPSVSTYRARAFTQVAKENEGLP
ncbi:formate C-acetyltransferase/glycerol dehydratase family glycyl radical enzyme, partial [Peptococcaceae bacterium 1198_IL3148]